MASTDLLHFLNKTQTTSRMKLYDRPCRCGLKYWYSERKKPVCIASLREEDCFHNWYEVGVAESQTDSVLGAN